MRNAKPVRSHYSLLGRFLGYGIVAVFVVTLTVVTLALALVVLRAAIDLIAWALR